MIDTNIENLEALLNTLGDQILSKFILTILIIVGLALLRKLILRFVNKHVKNEHAILNWEKYSYYSYVAILLVLIFDLWFKGFSNVLTIIGLLAAGIAFALKDPIMNFFGWLFIVWRGPIKIGDRVEIDINRGDVIDITPFHFYIMEIGNWVDAEQYTGRILSVPNGKVFTHIKANYSQGFEAIWNEISITITFESNWKKAKKLMLQIADKHGDHYDKKTVRDTNKTLRTYLISAEDMNPKVYTDITGDGIEYTLRYLCKIRRRRETEDLIRVDILEAFSDHDDIMFAHPTRRFFQNPDEGKKGTQNLPPPKPDVE